MFILKGLLILIIFIFILGLFASFWLRYTFRKMHRNFNRMHGKDDAGEKKKQEKRTTGSKKEIRKKGDYVDFEEVD
jgi:hypothetical protein